MRSSKTSWHFTVVLAAVIAALAFTSGPAAASLPAMYSARALGMGGAYTAVADDATALYWNPAALGSKTLSVNLGLGLSGSGDLAAFQGLTENADDLKDLLKVEGQASMGVGLLIGANIGSIGAGYMADGGAQLTKGPQLEFDGNLNLNSNIALGIARNVVGNGGAGGLGVRAGVVVRSVEAARSVYKSNLDGTDKTSNQESGKGYAADLGVLVRVTDVFTVGATARNVIAKTNWTTSGEETPQTEFRLGVALQPPLLGGTISADIATGGQFRIGLEKSLLFGGMRVRLGQVFSDGSSWTTAGLGFALGPVAIDTAVITGAGSASLHYAIEASLAF